MEVLLATLLFILLSPGLIFTLPPGKGGILEGESTSHTAVLVHACLFFVAQKLTSEKVWPFNMLNDGITEIRKSQESYNKKALPTSVMIAPLVATFLFIILSPGMIITLPPDEGALFMSEDTNTIAVLVHGLIYFTALKFWASGIELELDASSHMVPHNSIIAFLNEQFNAI